VGSIRPLSNGRVLVADPVGQVLARVDLDDGTLDTLGGVGQGPQEYRQPDALLPLPGDTTLLVDLGNGRLVEVGPEGTFGRTYPLARQGSGGQLIIVIPRFTDGEGGYYYEPEEIRGGAVADSALVMRFPREGFRGEVVCAIKLADPPARRGGGGVILGRRPLGPRDDWAVAPDGRVAVVRDEGYRVEWITPDGRRRVGPENPIRTERVGRAEKEAWFQEFLNGEISTGIRRFPDGSREVTFRRGSSSRPPEDLDAYDWPDRLPPFRAKRSRVSPAGELWVERWGPVGTRPLVDIFDDAGERVADVELPAGRRLVGFGPGVVYLARTDEYGLEWLERYLKTWAPMDQKTGGRAVLEVGVEVEGRVHAHRVNEMTRILGTGMAHNPVPWVGPRTYVIRRTSCEGAVSPKGIRSESTVVPNDVGVEMLVAS